MFKIGLLLRQKYDLASRLEQVWNGVSC